jgi:hypothetical protein
MEIANGRTYLLNFVIKIYLRIGAKAVIYLVYMKELIPMK